MAERFTAEQIAEMLADPNTTVVVCSSRCLWCGRGTPHEVCHAHATELGFMPESVADIEALWDSGQEPEPCANPNCPVWEPGEWARRTGQEGRGHGE